MLWQGGGEGQRAGGGRGKRRRGNELRQEGLFPLVLQSRARPNWYALIAAGA